MSEDGEIEAPEFLANLIKMKAFNQELTQTNNEASIRLFHQKYNPFEKVLRYNFRHGFILFAQLYHGNISPTAMAATTSALSIANGAIQMVDGVFQITKESLHPTRDKAMGALKIISGATGIAFSYTPWLAQLGQAGLTGATALAAPAFALTRLVDLACTAIDYHYALKETTLSGWLEERYKEVKHLNKEIAEIYRLPLNKKISEEYKNKLENLEKKKFEVEEKISARLFCENEHTNNKVKFTNSSLNTLHATYCTHLKEKNLDDDEKKRLRNLNDTCMKEANNKEKEEFKKLVVKTLAFSGALLLAVAPFTGPAAPALLGIGLAISIGVGLYSGGKLLKENNKRVDKLFTEVSNKLKNAITLMKPKTEFEMAKPRFP